MSTTTTATLIRVPMRKPTTWAALAWAGGRGGLDMMCLSLELGRLVGLVRGEYPVGVEKEEGQREDDDGGDGKHETSLALDGCEQDFEATGLKDVGRGRGVRAVISGPRSIAVVRLAEVDVWVDE